MPLPFGMFRFTPGPAWRSRVHLRHYRAYGRGIPGAFGDGGHNFASGRMYPLDAGHTRINLCQEQVFVSNNPPRHPSSKFSALRWQGGLATVGRTRPPAASPPTGRGLPAPVQSVRRPGDSLKKGSSLAFDRLDLGFGHRSLRFGRSRSARLGQPQEQKARRDAGDCLLCDPKGNGKADAGGRERDSTIRNKRNGPFPKRRQIRRQGSEARTIGQRQSSTDTWSDVAARNCLSKGRNVTGRRMIRNGQHIVPAPTALSGFFD